MLSFAEELLILLVDEERGDFINIPERTLNYALAAAVLLELALENRIDTDDTSVTLVDDTPLDDDLFDLIDDLLVIDLPIHYHVKFLLVLVGVIAVLLVTYQLFVRYSFIGRALNGPRARGARTAG